MGWFLFGSIDSIIKIYVLIRKFKKRKIFADKVVASTSSSKPGYLDIPISISLTFHVFLFIKGWFSRCLLSLLTIFYVFLMRFIHDLVSQSHLRWKKGPQTIKFLSFLIKGFMDLLLYRINLSLIHRRNWVRFVLFW